MAVKNKRIKDFTLMGEIAGDSYLWGNREKVEKLIDVQMRDFGYVPHLDLDTQYFIHYNVEKDTYSFELIAFGVYVGKQKAWKIAGLSGSEYVMK